MTFVAPPHPWGALVTACLALFLIAVNTTAINTAVSAIAGDLTISSTTLGWALNAYLLAVAAFVVLGGQLGDVLGRKRVFIIGIALYTLAAVVVASSGSAAQLIGGRALQGTGAAILMPATMAILHDAFPKEKQGLVLGIWGAVGGVAFAVGPLIGGFFTDAISWRWVWWSNVPVAVIALVLAGPMLRGLAGRKRSVRFDVAGLGCTTASFADALRQRGMRVSGGAAPTGVRMVTHRHIDDAAVDEALASIRLSLPSASWDGPATISARRSSSISRWRK